MDIPANLPEHRAERQQKSLGFLKSANYKNFGNANSRELDVNSLILSDGKCCADHRRWRC